jgi:hypothetical protein
MRGTGGGLTARPEDGGGSISALGAGTAGGGGPSSDGGGWAYIAAREDSLV